MARPLRIEFEGAFYHVMSRGERLDPIFQKDADRLHFLDGIGRMASKYDIRIHAYVLMRNHYHLLVETPRANLCRSMQHLNTTYANWHKAKYDVVGAIFQGRYKSLLIEHERYLLTLSLYLHLNPVRAGLVDRPEAFRWSSCGAFLGKRPKPDWLILDTTLNLFSGGLSGYRRALNDALVLPHGIPQESVSGRHGVLGSARFTAEMIQKAGALLQKENAREVPDAKALGRIRYEDLKLWIMKTWNVDEDSFLRKRTGAHYKKMLLCGAKRYTALSLKEIGAFFGMDYTAVSQACARFERKIQEDPESRKMVEQMEQWVERKRGWNSR